MIRYKTPKTQVYLVKIEILYAVSSLISAALCQLQQLIFGNFKVCKSNSNVTFAKNKQTPSSGGLWIRIC